MVIISKAIHKKFSETHLDAGGALEKWYRDIKASDWKNFADVKRTSNTADQVGHQRYVFDIKGKRYRLIALVIFKVRKVFIFFIGTHKVYDSIEAGKLTFKK